MMKLITYTSVAAAAAAAVAAAASRMSILGDPGMQSPVPAVGFEAWNFCNYAGAPAGFPISPSPEAADCPVSCAASGPCVNAVTVADNALGPGDAFPNSSYPSSSDVNTYAITKQQYLGDVCAKPSRDGNVDWAFWMVMFKSGNMNTGLPLCNATSITGAAAAPGLGLGLGFNNLPMNQPLMVHSWSNASWPLPYGGTGVVGYFSGTYDVDPAWNASTVAAVQAALHDFTGAWYAYRLQEIANVSGAPPEAPPLLAKSSFLTALWYRNTTSGAWVFYNVMHTSSTYPWLMNYLRTNSVSGGSGGTPWDGRGNMLMPAANAANVNISVRLRILDVGAPSNQFYLPEISGCWKPDGSPCVGTGPGAFDDITRYLCFVVNPAITAGCSATTQHACPPYHVSFDGTVIYRNNTAAFPYKCYHMYCAPPGSNSTGSGTCDPYSNPVPQELIQVIPCEEWAPHGFPSVPGQGWVGDDRLWNLDVAGFTSRFFMYGQEPAAAAHRTLPQPMRLGAYPGANRSWVSFEIGLEQLDGSGDQTVRWEVTDWDVTVDAP